MLKEIFSQKLNTQSKTVNNAIITLGDTDDSGKGRKFKSRFIQPGIAGYPGQFGTALIRKESFDKFIYSLRGKSVIINHKDVITEEDKVGEVHDVWFNPDDGWYWCNGLIWDETAQNLITNKGWSVSCSYDVKLADDAGGTENNIPYDIEFLDGVFTHLAIVDNPRYERANIVFNSKTVVKNDADFEAKHPRDEQGRFTDIPSDSNGYSIKLKKSNKISLNMAKALQKGFYPEEQVSITLPKNTKEGKKLNRLFEENKSFKKNYKLVYEHDDGQAFYDWDKKDFVKSELRYFDTKEELDVALEKLKDDPKFKGVITQKEVEEWHHISGGGKNRLIDINALKKLGFSVDTSTANKEFVLNGREIMAQDNQEDFNPMFKNNEIQNWNEADHPRDEAGKFTDKGKGYKNQDMEYSPLRKWAIKFETERLEREKKRNELKGKLTREAQRKDYDTFYKEYGELFDSEYDAKKFYTTIKQEYKREVIRKIMAQNNKEQDMALIDELKKLITKVENNKEQEMTEKIENEKVDKRDIIRQIMAIAGKHEDNEDVRTIAKLAEKLAYDKSEAGTADNECDDEEEVKNKKVKNEDEEDEKKYDDLKKDVKEDVQNKCKNSVDNAKGGYFDKMNEIYNSANEPKEENLYISREQKLKNAEEYFAK